METTINLWNPITFVWDLLIWILKVPLEPIDIVVQMAAVWANSEPELADSRWRIILIVSSALSVISVLPFADWWAAILFVFSVLVHEYFHAMSSKYWGVPARLITILILGAAAIMDTKKFNKLSHIAQAGVFISGPIGSLAVGLFFMGSGYAALSIGFTELATVFMQFANFNIMLVLFNAFVFGALDGGRLFKVVYASLLEKDEKYVMIPIAILTVISFWVIFKNTRNFEILLLIPLLIGGYLLTSFTDDPEEAYSPKRMSRAQVVRVVVMYSIVVIVAALLYPHLPSWISLLHAP